MYIYIYIHFIYKHYIHTGSQKQPKAATQNNTNTTQQIYPQNQKVEYRLKVDCIQEKLNIQVFLNVQLFKKTNVQRKTNVGRSWYWKSPDLTRVMMEVASFFVVIGKSQLQRFRDS